MYNNNISDVSASFLKTFDLTAANTSRLATTNATLMAEWRDSVRLFNESDRVPVMPYLRSVPRLKPRGAAVTSVFVSTFAMLSVAWTIFSLIAGVVSASHANKAACKTDKATISPGVDMRWDLEGQQGFMEAHTSIDRLGLVVEANRAEMSEMKHSLMRIRLSLRKHGILEEGDEDTRNIDKIKRPELRFAHLIQYSDLGVLGRGTARQTRTDPWYLPPSELDLPPSELDGPLNSSSKLNSWRSNILTQSHYNSTPIFLPIKNTQTVYNGRGAQEATDLLILALIYPQMLTMNTSGHKKFLSKVLGYKRSMVIFTEDQLILAHGLELFLSDAVIQPNGFPADASSSKPSVKTCLRTDLCQTSVKILDLVITFPGVSRPPVSFTPFTAEQQCATVGAYVREEVNKTTLGRYSFRVLVDCAYSAKYITKGQLPAASRPVMTFGNTTQSAKHSKRICWFNWFYPIEPVKYPGDSGNQNPQWAEIDDGTVIGRTPQKEIGRASQARIRTCWHNSDAHPINSCLAPTILRPWVGNLLVLKADKSGEFVDCDSADERSCDGVENVYDREGKE
ncbi:hypothetical protein B0H17DRAFT_1139549 [Mycena rosella]|uniref:Uncharacterized protein n=1 Tax=Mycena rosella TaxID=1033263 RepID=A0AAD7D3V2_MYCRO|nr:hypothetical protein B0H17DRAFT_1139549 [Mycena rosella]